MNSNNENSAINSTAHAKDKAPGRTIGISVMSAMILFVAFWMNHQNIQPSDRELTAAAVIDRDLTGFRSDAWYLPDDDLLGFIEIPAGSFIMGSNPALDRMAYENERWSTTRRQGSVDLPSYYMGRYEVTVAQFQEFVSATQLATDSVALDEPGNHPVTGVSWPESLAYARWLEQQLRTSPQTPASLRELLDRGGRITLPSEAEWEKAARGTDGRVFPWGTAASTELANFNAAAVVAVGAIACAECAHGLSDMSGNVWELTRSPYQDYPYNPGDDADNLSEDALWVMRGGSFADTVNNVRTAVRGGVDPGVRNDTIGFRLVITTL